MKVCIKYRYLIGSQNIVSEHPNCSVENYVKEMIDGHIMTINNNNEEFREFELLMCLQFGNQTPLIASHTGTSLQVLADSDRCTWIVL